MLLVQIYIEKKFISGGKRLSHWISNEYLFIVSTTEYMLVVSSIQKLVLPQLEPVKH